MARRQKIQEANQQSLVETSTNVVVDEALIEKAIENAPSVKGGLLVTFRPKGGGTRKHETIPAHEVVNARNHIMVFLRSGLELVV